LPAGSTRGELRVALWLMLAGLFVLLPFTPLLVGLRLPSSLVADPSRLLAIVWCIGGAMLAAGAALTARAWFVDPVARRSAPTRWCAAVLLIGLTVWCLGLARLSSGPVPLVRSGGIGSKI
jgi:hypothetical protein